MSTQRERKWFESRQMMLATMGTAVSSVATASWWLRRMGDGRDDKLDEICKQLTDIYQQIDDLFGTDE